MSQPAAVTRTSPLEGHSSTLGERVMDCLRERFVVVDRDWRIVVVNEAALPSGLEKRDVIFKKLFDVYPNLERQGFETLIARVFHSGKSHIEFYVQHTTVDGKTGYFHRKIIPILKGNLVEGVIVMIENVNEEIVAKKQAEQKDFEYKQLIETLQLVSFELDAAGNFIKVNSAALPVLGYRAEDLVGKSFTRLVHSEDVQRMWQIYWQIVNQGRSFGVCENRFTSATGKYIHMRWSIHPLLDSDGTIVGCRGVGENISEAAERTTHFKEKFEVFQQAFQIAPTPLVIVRGDRVEALNRAAHMLTGVSRKTEKNFSVLEIFQESDAEIIKKFINAPLGTGRTTILANVQTSSKRIVPCSVTITPSRFGTVIALDVQHA